MIAHVAEASENRGRVVLQLTAGRMNPMAVAAAIRVAQAFQSELESLFVEDEMLVDAASFPFSREVSLSGRASRPLSRSDIEHEMQLIATAVGRQIEAMAHAADVPLRRTVVRDDPVQALSRACTECGPWNVVALAEPLSSRSSGMISKLFDAVPATGIVVVGPAAKRVDGPYIVVVEDIAHLEPMLRTAHRLIGETEPESGVPQITVLLIADTDDKLAWLEGQARLALEGDASVRIRHARATSAMPGVIADIVRRLHGGFLIGEFGGLLVPRDGDLGPLAMSLECPLLLVK